MMRHRIRDRGSLTVELGLSLLVIGILIPLGISIVQSAARALRDAPNPVAASVAAEWQNTINRMQRIDKCKEPAPPAIVAECLRRVSDDGSRAPFVVYNPGRNTDQLDDGLCLLVTKPDKTDQQIECWSIHRPPLALDPKPDPAIWSDNAETMLRQPAKLVSTTYKVTDTHKFTPTREETAQSVTLIADGLRSVRVLCQGIETPIKMPEDPYPDKDEGIIPASPPHLNVSALTRLEHYGCISGDRNTHGFPPAEAAPGTHPDTYVKTMVLQLCFAHPEYVRETADDDVPEFCPSSHGREVTVWASPESGDTQDVSLRPPDQGELVARKPSTLLWPPPQPAISSEVRYRKIAAPGEPPEPWTYSDPDSTDVSSRLRSITLPENPDMYVHYEWQVRYKNGDASSLWVSGPPFMLRQTNPLPPSGLQCTPAGKEVTLSWKASPASDVPAKGYEVLYRRRDITSEWTPAASVEVTDPPSETVTTTVGSLRSQTLYEWQIAATADLARSDWVPETPVSCRTLIIVPDPPTGLGWRNPTTSSVTVNWSAPDPAPDTYVIRYRIPGKTWTEKATLETTDTIINLAGGTTYEWGVKAINSAGSSSWRSGPVFLTRPEPPTGLACGTAGIDRFTATWNAPSTPPDEYKFRVRPQSGGSWSNEETTPNPRITIGGLNNDRTYEWQTRTRKGADTSDWAPNPPATCKTLLAPPDAPTLLAVTEPGVANATLNWTAPTTGGKVGDYLIQYKTKDATDWVTPTITVNAPSTTHTLTGLTRGTSYEWQIQASNTAGNSAWVDGADFTTLNILLPTPVITEKPCVRQGGLKGYEVDWGTAPDGSTATKQFRAWDYGESRWGRWRTWDGTKTLPDPYTSCTYHIIEDTQVRVKYKVKGSILHSPIVTTPGS